MEKLCHYKLYMGENEIIFLRVLPLHASAAAMKKEMVCKERREGAICQHAWVGGSWCQLDAGHLGGASGCHAQYNQHYIHKCSIRTLTNMSVTLMGQLVSPTCI